MVVIRGTVKKAATYFEFLLLSRSVTVLLFSGLFLLSSCTSLKIENGPVNLKSNLINYFLSPHSANAVSANSWIKEVKIKTREEAEGLSKIIVDSAREAGIKNGEKKRFDNRILVFDNPFGLKEKCPMRFAVIPKGKKPASGWPVFIDIHGSGPVDMEYRIHQKRFKYYSGLLVVPRCPNDVTTVPTFKKGGIWRHWYLPVIEKLVSDLVLFGDADPNRIYLMGFSEGGYFAYRAIPEISDRFAGIAPASGGGGSGTWVDNLVNIPFYAQSGEVDNGYGRAVTFRKMRKAIFEAEKRYPGRLHCRLVEHKGCGHQIPDTKKEFSAPLWLAQFARNPYPDLVIWQQKKDVECYVWRLNKPGFTYPYVPKSHYWLNVDDLLANYARIEARLSGNKIFMKSEQYKKIMVRLNDKMVNLDKPVTIYFNGKKVFSDIVKRKFETMLKTWEERRDPAYIFPVEITVTGNQG